MAEDGLRIGGLSSGLAVVLSDKYGDDNLSKGHLVSYRDEIRNQSVEHTLEQIFDLPFKSLGPLCRPVDSSVIHAIIRSELSKVDANLKSQDHIRDGMSTIDSGCGPNIVALDVSSICGEITTVVPPLLVESLAMFSSVRANAYVWKGKWMYEIILETSGIQQLGWATVSCPFTDQKGVGDADDSYAFDGRRVKKWNKEAEPYGQSWVVGDVIGCCIDLDDDQISFFRNGVSLGAAFRGIRKMGPGSGYYPAISLSQGERCDINFGARPFRYPIEGYLPLQAPPSTNVLASRLLHYFSRLLDMYHMEGAECSSVVKLRRLNRVVAFEDLFVPISRAICRELFSKLEADDGSPEYIACGPLLSFMMDVFRVQAPHDNVKFDRVLDIFLEFPASNSLFEHIINALSRCCKTACLVLTECPYSGSYPYLALACHFLRREEIMVLWWKSLNFELLYEGFLSRKHPNREDLQCLMPSVWWPGSCEDVSSESSMVLTTTALCEAISKVRTTVRTVSVESS